MNLVSFKKNTIIFLIFLCFSALHGQQHFRSNIWYFGKNAGINFKLGTACPPEPIRGPFETYEAAAVMSDLEGNVLFSTDAVTVYDRNGDPMPNGSGLAGSISEKQVLIMPHPGNPDQYYIYTTGEGIPLVHEYTLIDMSLNDDLGDVVMSPLPQKNLPLAGATQMIEGVTGIVCADKSWIVSQVFDDNKYLAYKVDHNGLHANSPEVSKIGPVSGNTTNSMKFSHDGAKIAIEHFKYRAPLEKALLLGDFDLSTGEIFDMDTIILEDETITGFEFSPDNTKLYVAAFYKIIQVDLANNNTQTVIYSDRDHSYFSGLSLGPDGKIYVASIRRSILSVINQPDMAGTAADFDFNGFRLLRGTATVVGFINFVQNYTVSTCTDIMLSYTNNDQLPDLFTSASTSIKAGSGVGSSTVTSGTTNKTSLQAGNYIELSPNFEAKPSIEAYFSAYISPCNGSICSGGSDKRSMEGANMVEENSEEEREVISLQLFPNPLKSSELQLKYTLAEDKPVSIFLYNAVGQEVRRLADGIRPGAGSHSHTFDVSGLAAGIYTCRMQAGEKVVNQKLVVP